MIIYALVSVGNTVLAEYTATSGTFVVHRSLSHRQFLVQSRMHDGVVFSSLSAPLLLFL